MKLKGIKKVISLTAALALLTAAVPAAPAYAADDQDAAAAKYFSDMNTKVVSYDAVKNLSSRGYISGYPDGTFRPDDYITRAEISGIFANIITASYDIDKAAGSGNTIPGSEDAAADLKDTQALTDLAEAAFSDLNQSRWAEPYIGTMALFGIAEGSGNGIFKPLANITYNELVTMAVQAADGDMTKYTGVWPENYIKAGQDMGLYKGLGDFDPETDGADKATRGSAAIIINNALTAVEKASEDGYTVRSLKIINDTNGATMSEILTGLTDDSSADAGKLELTYEEALRMMQEDGILAETAKNDAAADKAVLKSINETITTVRDGLDLINSPTTNLETAYSLQSSGITQANLDMSVIRRDFYEANLANNYQAEMNSIISQTTELYYGIQQLEQSIEAGKANLDHEKELLTIAQKKHELGMISDLALSQQEYSVTSAESSLKQSETSLETTMAQFSMLLGVDTDTDLVLTTPVEVTDSELPALSDAIDSLLANDLTLKNLEMNIQVIERQLKSLKYTYSQSSSTYKSVEAAYESLVAQQSQLITSDKTTLSNNYASLASLENQIDTYKETIALTEKSLAVMQVQYDLGMITESDLNGTKLSLIQANQGLTAAIVSYNEAVEDILLSIGVGTSRVEFTTGK